MSLITDLFTKKENLKNLDLYQLIALFNALIHKKDNVYTDSKGKKFVLTRYGFVPAEQPNLLLKTEQQAIQIDHLEIEVRVLQNDIKNYITENKKLKQDLQKRPENGIQIIKYSFNSHYNKLKKSYLTLMTNNHNLIVRIKQLKSEINKLTTKLIDEKGKNKIAQKKTTAQQKYNEEYIIYKINEVILHAENNQIAKMLEKLKSVVAHQENLKQKSDNQKALITKLEMINKNLEEELFELKMKNLKNDKK